MIKLNNPWSGMELPLYEASLTSRRVSEIISWDIFWAIDFAQNKLMIMEFNDSIDISGKLPQLRGLDIELFPQPQRKKTILAIRLLENNNSDIFHQLCLDIISATEKVETEKGAVQSFLMRTWRWHRMLERGGVYPKLSREEQKGLIAELYVLERILFALIGISHSIKAWVGPLGAPKDFAIGNICLEAKAKRSPTIAKVTISSANQLDTSDIRKLYLHVSEVEEQAHPDSEGFTIVDQAKNIQNKIMAEAPLMLDMYIEKLQAVGLDFEDDYSEYFWMLGKHELYEVLDNFPRVVPSMLSEGVVELGYAITLDECERFKVGIHSLRKEINKDDNDE